MTLSTVEEEAGVITYSGTRRWVYNIQINREAGLFYAAEQDDRFSESQ